VARFFQLGVTLSYLAICACPASENKEGKTNTTPPGPGISEKPGKVTISTVPSAASVLINGRDRIGKTPITLERKGGTRLHLHLVKEGYKYARRVEFFVAGTTRQSHIRLSRATGKIVVTSTPIKGARIIIDGQRSGKTPDRIAVPIGEHHVSVARDGFLPFSTKVTVKEGEETPVQAGLMPMSVKGAKGKLGFLSLTSNRLALVHLDGKLFGVAPLRRIPLQQKKYTLEVSNPALAEKKTIELRIVKGKHTQLNISLGPEKK
jgi:hypothetical protein